MQKTEEENLKGREKNQQREVLQDSPMKCYLKMKGIST